MADVLTVSPSPETIIHRLGPVHRGGPLAWPELAWIRSTGGGNRFDDPRGKQAAFTTLYAAETVDACYAEILDQFRPGHVWIAQALARITPLPPDDHDNFDPTVAAPVTTGRVPADFLGRRRIASFRVVSRQPFLDVRSDATETAEALSTERDMALLLRRIPRPRIKPGDFTGNDRAITQAIALWAYQHQFAGLAYTSSHDLKRRWTCWALFTHAKIVEANPPREIRFDDPILLSIARRFNLRIA